MLRLQLLICISAFCALHTVYAKDPCQSKCKSHEECGKDSSGLPVCLCKDKDKATGGATVCGGNSSASVSVATCYLREKGLSDWSNLHLNDPQCKGHLDSDTNMITFKFNSTHSCGTEIMAGKKKISYTNMIQTGNKTSGTPGLINRQMNVNVSFGCFYKQPEDTQIHFSVKGGKGLHQISSGSWNYSLLMEMCSDINCKKLFDLSKGVSMKDTLYIQVSTKDMDGDMIQLLTESCTATSKKGKGVKRKLIENGCPDPSDKSIQVKSNKKGGTMIVFKMFRFKGESQGFGLGCKMKLCLKKSRGCAQSCKKPKKGGKKTRSLRGEEEDDDDAFNVNFDF